MDWKNKLWHLKRWFYFLTDDYSRWTGLYSKYSTEFLECLGDQSNMKINGKGITIHVLGGHIMGAGKVMWIAQNDQLHHVFIICSKKSLCQFEMNVIHKTPHTIITGILPPWIMAEEVKKIIDN